MTAKYLRNNLYTARIHPVRQQYSTRNTARSVSCTALQYSTVVQALEPSRILMTLGRHRYFRQSRQDYIPMIMRTKLPAHRRTVHRCDGRTESVGSTEHTFSRLSTTTPHNSGFTNQLLSTGTGRLRTKDECPETSINSSVKNSCCPVHAKYIPYKCKFSERRGNYDSGSPITRQGAKGNEQCTDRRIAVRLVIIKKQHSVPPPGPISSLRGAVTK